MENVAIYLRKSRDDNGGIEETLARHKTQLLDYCKRNGLIIEKIYKEVVSGDTIENRPEMQRLLEDVALRKYSGVVCMEIERLSRGNVIDQVEILDTFKESGTKIYTLSKIYDLSKEDIDEEYFEFALFMSRREYKTIKRRLMRGMNQATKDGYYTGSILPYGFTKEKQGKGWVLIKEPFESQIVKEMFEKYVGGFGTNGLARYLNNKGIKPRSGEKWTPNSVLWVIRNQNYIGKVHSCKYKEWYEGKHEGFIDPDLFFKAQEKLGHSPRTEKKITNPLASLVKCSICGRTMLRRPNRKYNYLVCPGLDCPTKGARFETVEERLIDEIGGALENYNYFLESAPKTNNKEIKSLESELKKRKEMLTRACEAYEKGAYTIEVYKNRSEKLESEIGAILKRIEELKTQEKEEKNFSSMIPNMEKVIKKYPSLSAEDKNLLLKTIVKECIYEKTERGDFKLDIKLLL